MVSAGDFRKGITFVMDGNVYVVVDFQHVKPGKGAAFVRTRLKNAITGQTLERTFNPSEKFEMAHIDRKTMQYLYSESDLFYFMDVETYEQIPFNKSTVEDALKFIIEGMNVSVSFFNGKPFSVEPPNFVELEIIVCDPGLQGDTSKAGNKPATLETGYVIQVPLFVNNHEKVRVDTRDGSYMERV